MDKINKETIKIYINKLHARGESASVVKRKMASVKRFIGWAKTKGYVKELDYQEINKALGSHINKIHVILNEVKNLAKRKLRFTRSFDPAKGGTQDDKEGGFTFGLQHYIAFLVILIFVATLGAGIYNQFFKKTAPSLAYPTTPTRAGRMLSFQGRLTDSLGNPITTATNVIYKLYNVSTGGTALYTAGACSTTPDQDGIFNTLVGGSGYTPTPPQSVCGTEITSDIFSENANIYLGVTVASDAEMTPRQQIANVGYAINAETLQGLPPGQTVSTIPYINGSGDLLIAAANPGVRSTYVSSAFTISSAQATTIQSAGTGKNNLTNNILL